MTGNLAITPFARFGGELSFLVVFLCQKKYFSENLIFLKLPDIYRYKEKKHYRLWQSIL